MRPVDVVKRVAPHARPAYLAAFEAGDAQLAAAGITTPLRLAHFLAQTLEETGGYTVTAESGNYSAPRIVQVWPGRFPSVAAAEPYAHNAEKLFNHVYANRMGNGGPVSGDGFRYRGRGILQTTGREAYRRYGRRCSADFEGNPDLILTAEHALAPALGEWVDSGCNALADRDDIHAITKRINGGYTGFAERVRWLGVVKRVIGIGPVELKPAKPAVPPYLEPLPRPPVAPAPIGPADHVGIWGSIGAALCAAWKAFDHAPWWVAALIVIVGVLAALQFAGSVKKGA